MVFWTPRTYNSTANKVKESLLGLFLQLWRIGIPFALATRMSEVFPVRLRHLVLRLGLFCIFYTLAASPARAASSLKLMWNQSADTNVVGYKVYYGAASHNYTNVVLVGNVTNTVITGIVAGIPYYFAATTLTASGSESPVSSEIVYVAPAVSSAAFAPGQFSCQVVGPPGSPYVVEASTDLVNWVCLETNFVPFTFVDTNTSSFGLRFYRTFSLP